MSASEKPDQCSTHLQELKDKDKFSTKYWYNKCWRCGGWSRSDRVTKSDRQVFGSVA